MKNKLDLSLLFNPFTRIAGARALFIGLTITLFTALLGYRNGIIFDGVIDIHFASTNLSTALFVQLISLSCLILIMYLAGKIFSSSSIRLIDVAGTMSFARIPFILASFITLFPIIGNTLNKLTNAVFTLSITDISNIDWIIIIFTTLVFFLSIIWFIILTYNAFRVSCNVKNGIIFTISFILAEVASKVLILILLSNTIGIMPSAETNTQPNPSNDKIKQIAVETALHIKNGEYDKTYEYFNDTLKQVLPTQELETVITEIESKFGKIKDINKNTNIILKDNYQIVLVPVQFEKTTINFRFTFNKQNQIIGFYF